MSRAGAGTKVTLGAASGAALYAWFDSAGEARQSIEWAWAFFQRVIDNGPIGLWAVMLAMLCGWLVTLRVGMLPMRCMSPTAASLIAQISGTVASFSIVWWLWREPLGLIVGAIVALAMPYSWSLVLILLEVCPWSWARRWAAELRGEGTQLSLFGGRR